MSFHYTEFSLASIQGMFFKCPENLKFALAGLVHCLSKAEIWGLGEMQHL